MDFALKTGCPVIGINDSRRRPHPGGRRRARPVRRDLPPQRPRLRASIPQISPDRGPVRGRRGLLPRDHRLHGHGRPDLAHVHHRPRRDQDGHRRGRRLRGAGRRPHPQHHAPASRTTWRPTRRTPSTTSRRCCRTCRPTTWPSPRRSRVEADLAITDEDLRARHADPGLGRTSRTTCTRSIEHVLDDGEFLEMQALFAPNILIGFGRVEGRPVGIVANQPMQFAGSPGHRRLREGRPLRAHLRRASTSRC